MALDIFFAEDIRNALDALKAAAQHYPSGEFRQGWLAALNAVAVAFGLPGAGPGHRPDTLLIPRKEVVEGREV